MSTLQETCVSTQDTFRSDEREDETSSVDVPALLLGLVSCLTKVDGTNLSAEEEEKKDDQSFPILSKINDLCRSYVGSKHIKNLEDLLTVYLQKVTSYVNDCYQKPIRATKLKACMNTNFVYFHFLYQDIKESVDNTLYLQKMTELMAMYLDLEIASSRRRKETTKKVVSRVASALNIYLDRSEDHILDALMRARSIKVSEREVCCPILQKILTSFQKRQMQDTLYVRYLLVFKLWKKIVSDAAMRKKINAMAIEKLPAPANFADRYKRFNNVLPRVPKDKDITTFYMQAKLDIKKACQSFMKISKDPTLPVMADKPPFFEGRSLPTYGGKGNPCDGGVSRNLMNEIWQSPCFNEKITGNKKSSNKKKAKRISDEKNQQTGDKKEKSDSISETDSTSDMTLPTPMDVGAPTWEAAAAAIQPDVVMIDADEPPPPGTEPTGCIRIVPTASLLPLPPEPLPSIKQQPAADITQPPLTFSPTPMLVVKPETPDPDETPVKLAPTAIAAERNEFAIPERRCHSVPAISSRVDGDASVSELVATLPQMCIKLERNFDADPAAGAEKVSTQETDVPATSEDFAAARHDECDQFFEVCEVQLGDQDLPYIEEEVVEPCNPVGVAEGDANYLAAKYGLHCAAGGIGESDLVRGVAASQVHKEQLKKEASNGLWPRDRGAASSASVSSKLAAPPSLKPAAAASTKEVQRSLSGLQLRTDIHAVPLQIKSERIDSPGYDEAPPVQSTPKPDRVHSSKSNGRLTSKVDREVSRVAEQVYSSKSGRTHFPLKGGKIPTASTEKTPAVGEPGYDELEMREPPILAEPPILRSKNHRDGEKPTQPAHRSSSSKHHKSHHARPDNMPTLQPQQPSELKLEKVHSSSSKSERSHHANGVKIPSQKVDKPSSEAKAEKTRSSSSSKSERSHHANGVKIPSQKVDKPPLAKADKGHSHSARVEQDDLSKCEMLPPNKMHSPRPEKSHSPRGEKSRSPRAERTHSPRIDGSQSPRTDVMHSPRAERTASPRVERTSSPQVETILSPRAERTSSSRKETISSPRAERTSSSRKETISSPRAERTSSSRKETISSPREERTSSSRGETMSSPIMERASSSRTIASPHVERTSSARVETKTSHRPENSASPRLEKMHSPRNDLTLSPRTERIRSPRSENVPSASPDTARQPRSEAFVSPHTVYSPTQLGTFVAPKPVAPQSTFVPPLPSFEPSTFVVPLPPPPEPCFSLAESSEFAVDAIQPTIQDHALPTLDADRYGLQQNLPSLEGLMQNSDGTFGGDDDFTNEHYPFSMDDMCYPFSGCNDDVLLSLNIADFHGNCMINPMLLEQRPSSEEDGYSSFPLDPMDISNARDIHNYLTSRAATDFPLDSKWQYVNSPTIPSSMPFMAGDEDSNYTQYLTPATSYPNDYSASEYHNPGGMLNLPENGADANTSFQSDSNSFSISIPATCDKNSLGQSYSKTSVSNSGTVVPMEETRTMGRKLQESSGDPFHKSSSTLNPSVRTDGFNAEDKLAALKGAGSASHKRSQSSTQPHENAELRNCSVLLPQLNETQRALGMSKPVAAQAGVRKGLRSGAKKRAPSPPSSSLGITYKRDAFFGGEASCNTDDFGLDQDETHQTHSGFNSEKKMRMDVGENNRPVTCSASKVTLRSVEIPGASRKQRKPR